MANPFTLSFGKKPLQYISRPAQTNDIISDFSAENPSSQVYMITGVRGSGKTVLLSTVSEHFRGESDWIVIELNQTRDLLQALGAKLYGIPWLQAKFLEMKIDFSFLGFGVSVGKGTPIVDIENALDIMLEQLHKAGKKLLVTIDEATNSEYMRVFASAFQIYIRKNYSLYLLLTGLYENIYDLQNDKSLTFLYRAPKLILEPLNYGAMCNQYEKALGISKEDAKKMAALTKGYSFAFQVLGYLYYNHPGNIEDNLAEYDQYLDDYVYEKIWSEMSEQDKSVAWAVRTAENHRVKSIRENANMASNLFSIYRERLLRKGIVVSKEYGHMEFVLPRFEEFLDSKFLYEE